MAYLYITWLFSLQMMAVKKVMKDLVGRAPQENQKSFVDSHDRLFIQRKHIWATVCPKNLCISEFILSLPLDSECNIISLIIILFQVVTNLILIDLEAIPRTPKALCRPLIAKVIVSLCFILPFILHIIDQIYSNPSTFKLTLNMTYFYITLDVLISDDGCEDGNERFSRKCSSGKSKELCGQSRSPIQSNNSQRSGGHASNTNSSLLSSNRKGNFLLNYYWNFLFNTFIYVGHYLKWILIHLPFNSQAETGSGKKKSKGTSCSLTSLFTLRCKSLMIIFIFSSRLHGARPHDSRWPNWYCST